MAPSTPLDSPCFTFFLLLRGCGVMIRAVSCVPRRPFTSTLFAVFSLVRSSPARGHAMVLLGGFPIRTDCGLSFVSGGCASVAKDQTLRPSGKDTPCPPTCLASLTLSIPLAETLLCVPIFFLPFAHFLCNLLQSVNVFFLWGR